MNVLHLGFDLRDSALKLTIAVSRLFKVAGG